MQPVACSICSARRRRIPPPEGSVCGSGMLYSEAELSALADGVLGRNRRALAKAITLVESTRLDHQEQAQRLLERLLPASGNAYRVGISGVPGVGKSTFIEALGTYLTGTGKRVAVLAVDPSSARTGGSILGDKTRMTLLSADANAFIRPSPSAGSLGGVARRTREVALVCEAAGYDVILVETVGVGQSEVAVASMVDFFLVLMLAGAGDELQGIKKGILEMADALAVNKADGDNVPAAQRAAAEYRGALRLFRAQDENWSPRVVTVSAVEGNGISELWTLVEEHHQILRDSGSLGRKRREQLLSWFAQLLDEGLRRAVLGRSEIAEAIVHLKGDIDQGKITPTEAARRLLRHIDASIDPGTVLD